MYIAKPVMQTSATTKPAARSKGVSMEYGNAVPKLLFYQFRPASGKGFEKRRQTGGYWRFRKLTRARLWTKRFPGIRGSSHRQHLTWDRVFGSGCARRTFDILFGHVLFWSLWRKGELPCEIRYRGWNPTREDQETRKGQGQAQEPGPRGLILLLKLRM